ncbi:MAG: efflux RND transporter periplasmic adaptor subunit [Clostridia bacterium]|nr:efflux RND transporter periplasmic adaptor subunit [Deltaproteobacteria bacterium]
MRRPEKRHIIIGVAVAVLLAGIGAYALTDDKEQRESAPANDSPELESGAIRFSDDFAKRAGISEEVVTEDVVSPVITVNGTMTYDPRRFAIIGARIGGRIRKLNKVEGDHVNVGETLAEVESAELGRAQSDVFAARADEKAAEANDKRERHLADARITSERDAELAQATFEAARAKRVAAEYTVTALGGQSDGSNIGVLALRSPIAGRVLTSKAARGQVVESLATIYEVADLDQLWLELEVYERDVNKVRVGDTAEISPHNGTTVIRGEVQHVGDLVDAETRSATVRIVVDNTTHTLRPGESVVARLQMTKPSARGLTISKRAITRIDGKPTVFVLRDKNTVEPRIVTLGASGADRVSVTEGLNEGETIVVDGMFALKSEIFR